MKDKRFEPGCANFVEEKNKIANLIEGKGAILDSFCIDDDGYQIKVLVGDEDDITLKEISNVVDNIDFEGYIVNDLLYRRNGVEAILVPITQTTMNDFVWNYVKMFLGAHEEIEALSIALGVLERMVETLPREIRNEYEEYSAMVFN